MLSHTSECLLLFPPFQARALWLVGTCSAQLEREQWVDGYTLVAGYMGSKDLVLALTAVQAVVMLTAQVGAGCWAEDPRYSPCEETQIQPL